MKSLRGSSIQNFTRESYGALDYYREIYRAWWLADYKGRTQKPLTAVLMQLKCCFLFRVLSDYGLFPYVAYHSEYSQSNQWIVRCRLCIIDLFGNNDALQDLKFCKDAPLQKTGMLGY